MNFIHKINSNYLFILMGLLLPLNLLHLNSKFGVDFMYTFATITVIIGSILMLVSGIMLQFVLNKKFRQ
ncbi:MAG: Unknown protein [uncultured Sulfurovum sp.]|uniref:Uncharacterized protein n=1 Tax=uncultured Sulfurovum sp. TaxID=269237 RepID=A0A6S6TDT5_9BACT|nr:MAG: Unknown protein [uncultured Sulfurovum sp.]